VADDFSAVDLSQLPFPDAVEELDYEVLLQEYLDDFHARMLAVDPAFVPLTEADPAYKVLEVTAYRELLMRQRVNEAIMALCLAYARGTDLDHIGARFECERLMLDEGDPDAVPPVEPTYEADDDYRRRIQLSFEGFSVAGPEGAYKYFASSADGDVLDISVQRPNPGEILITVLSRVDNTGKIPAVTMTNQGSGYSSAPTVSFSGGGGTGAAGTAVLGTGADAGKVVSVNMTNLGSGYTSAPTVAFTGGGGTGAAGTAVLGGYGIPTPALLAAVEAKLTDEQVRPQQDDVTVQAASNVDFAVVGELEVLAGPDHDVVKAAAQAELDAYIARSRRLGLDITLSAINAACHRPGVHRVNITSPVADVVVTKSQAARCTATTLTTVAASE
jgi:phage-related baseplate assembly protein